MNQTIEKKRKGFPDRLSERLGGAQRLLYGFLGAGLIAGLILLQIIPPGENGVYPQCAFHELTGLYCPGCGFTRGVYHLFRGRFVTAFSYNPLMIFAVFPLAAFIIYCLSAAIRGKKWRVPTPKPVHVWILLGIMILYWILRNLPYYPFNLLAPPPGP